VALKNQKEKFRGERKKESKDKGGFVKKKIYFI